MIPKEASHKVWTPPPHFEIERVLALFTWLPQSLKLLYALLPKFTNLIWVCRSMRGEEWCLSIGQLLWVNIGSTNVTSSGWIRAGSETFSPRARVSGAIHCGLRTSFRRAEPGQICKHPFHSSVLSPFGLHRGGKFCLIGKSTPERWLNGSQGNFLTYLRLIPPVLSKLGLRASRVKFN